MSIFQKAKSIVLKVGTSVITNFSGSLDREQIKNLVRQISFLRNEGKQIILVTSGAIAAGVERLNFPSRPNLIPALQAAASVGQGLLIGEYARFFSGYGIAVGQVLLTQYDFIQREQYVNAKNTLNKLLELGVIPIINENDTTAVEEIRFGDNDTLAALVTCAIPAQLMIILTDTEGLFAKDRSGKEKLLLEVNQITSEISECARGAGTPFGSGGMVTKLQAAKIVTTSGIGMIIANGRQPDVLLRIFQGEKLGTFFHPKEKRLTSRKHWIAFSLPSKGKIFIDDGAREALIIRKKSLLPAGIIGVEGDFKVGEAVEIANKEGKVFAKGLTNFSCDEVKKIKGLKSKEVSKIFPDAISDEIIHRDSLVILI